MDENRRQPQRKSIIILAIILCLLTAFISTYFVVNSTNKKDIAERGDVKFSSITHIENASVIFFIDNRKMTSMTLNKHPNITSANSSVCPFSLAYGTYRLRIEEVNNNLVVEQDIIIAGNTRIIAEIFRDKIKAYQDNEEANCYSDQL